MSMKMKMSQPNQNLNEAIEAQKQKLYSSTEPEYEEIEFADGTKIKIDSSDFYRIVDAIASNYGLGGCKNLKEFVMQIDETDMEILGGVINAIKKRNEEIYGEVTQSKPSEPSNQSSPKTSDSPPPTFGHRHTKGRKPSRMPVAKPPVSDKPTPTIKVDGSEGITAEGQKMAMFLKSWGADYNDVNQAVASAQKRMKDMPDVDISWINNDEIKKRDFDVRLALKALREARKGAINFNIGLHTLNSKKLKEEYKAKAGK